MSADGNGDGPTLDHILDDLCTRFLLNLPASEFESFERLFFAVESAHWFYDDFHREQHAGLPRLQLKAFAQKLFDHTPLLQPYSGDVDKLVREFKSYKNEIPTCGAAMLNPALDKVVLVRGWGKDGKWGFPKGKMAKFETELQAAVREVEEETGLNLAKFTDEKSTAYIDSMMAGRLNRIFIVPNIPENTRFQTQTRKEISDIQWIPITSLPFDKDRKSENRNNNNGSKGSSSAASPSNHLQASRFLYPYTSRLRGWIKREKKRRKKEQNAANKQNNNNGDANSSSVNNNTTTTTNGYYANGNANGNGNGHAIVAPAAIPVPESSPTKHTTTKNGRGRKNQRNGHNGNSSRNNYNNNNNYHQRDADTFGLSGGPRSLTDAERESMFRSYVKESERRVRELQLNEDGWLTNGNRTPTLLEMDKRNNNNNNEDATKKNTNSIGVVVSVSTASSGSLSNNNNNNNSANNVFTFDSDAIVARMHRAVQ